MLCNPCPASLPHSLCRAPALCPCPLHKLRWHAGQPPLGLGIQAVCIRPVEWPPNSPPVPTCPTPCPTQVRRLISNPTVKKDFGALLAGQSPDRRKLAQLIDLLERMMQVGAGWSSGSWGISGARIHGREGCLQRTTALTCSGACCVRLAHMMPG